MDQQLFETFIFYDYDCDGKLDVKGLQNALRVLGQNLTETEIKEYKQRTIDHEEFQQIIMKKGGQSTKDIDIQFAFNIIDRDNDGYINTEELKHTMTSVGDKLSKQDIELMIKELDTENQGKISKAAFMGLINTK